MTQRCYPLLSWLACWIARWLAGAEQVCLCVGVCWWWMSQTHTYTHTGTGTGTQKLLCPVAIVSTGVSCMHVCLCCLGIPNLQKTRMSLTTTHVLESYPPLLFFPLCFSLMHSLFLNLYIFHYCFYLCCLPRFLQSLFYFWPLSPSVPFSLFFSMSPFSGHFWN